MSDLGAIRQFGELYGARALRFIEGLRDGVDSLVSGEAVPVTELVQANVTAHDVLDEDGKDVGRRVEFTMRGHHVATWIYGPPRSGFIFKKKRRLSTTQFHV